MRQTNEDKAESDEINPQDGLLRSWMFYNGDWVETTFGLTAAIALVFWCFLYVLGLSQSILGYVLFAAAIVGSIGWYALYRSLFDYEETGWRKGKGRSARLERNELRIAIALWLFIFISVSIILFLEWRHDH